jgi:ketosteroid isomerase-like protein
MGPYRTQINSHHIEEALVSDVEAEYRQIRTLIYRYCRAVDRLDIPLGHSIWHDDAIADYGKLYNGPGRGVIDYICASHLKLTHHTHQVTNVTIEFDGDRAASEAYATVTTRAARGEGAMQMTMWARYLDRWSKREGHWAIDKRVMIVDLDEVREIKVLGNEARGSRDKADPSYAILNLRG